MVRIERAPPLRLLTPTRWRSFKMGPDRIVWEEAMREAQALLDAGWRVRLATVHWGRRVPCRGAAERRELRALLSCGEGCMLEVDGAGGRAETTLTLGRDDA